MEVLPVQSASTASVHINRPPHHFAFVDALRGYAILGVLMIHVGKVIPFSFTKFRELTDSGENGVMLFFVVSAFTLFWSLQNRITVDRSPLKAFYVRRFFRIAPLFWAGMAFYLWQPDVNRAEFAPNGVGWQQIITTFFFVHGWYPTTITSVVPGGWSIAAEVMFYLCIPLLHKYVKSLLGALWITLISTGICRLMLMFGTHILTRHFPESWHSLIGDFQYWIFPSQLPVFCMGLVLYFILMRQMSPQPSEPTDKNNWTYCLIAIAIWLMLRQTPDQVIFAGAFVLIAWGLATHPVRILVNPVVRFIGVISYSIYIWHFCIIQHISPRVISTIHLFHKPELNGIAQFFVLYGVMLLLSVVIATASYHIIEKPSQKLGRRLIEKMDWGAAGTRSF